MNMDGEFAQFWEAYPKKRKKLDAQKAFNQARRSGVTLAHMLEALDWQRSQSQWVRDDGQYIPFPASWLRAGSYDDEPEEACERPRWVCPHTPSCQSKVWCSVLRERQAS
jgi:hypothetical protein